MAIVQIKTLNPAGYELFGNAETYVDALSDLELSIQGGCHSLFDNPIVITSVVISWM